MSWWDSVVDTVSGRFGGDSDSSSSGSSWTDGLGKAIINGGVSAYNAYNKNKAAKDYLNSYNSVYDASSADYADYQNYLNELAKWQAENPNYGASRTPHRSFPYMGQLQGAIRSLEPYAKMSKKQTKLNNKIYKSAINTLNDLNVKQDYGTPAYALDTGIGDFIKKAKKND